MTYDEKIRSVINKIKSKKIISTKIKILELDLDEYFKEKFDGLYYYALNDELWINFKNKLEEN